MGVCEPAEMVRELRSKVEYRNAIGQFSFCFNHFQFQSVSVSISFCFNLSLFQSVSVSRRWFAPAIASAEEIYEPTLWPAADHSEACACERDDGAERQRDLWMVPASKSSARNWSA